MTDAQVYIQGAHEHDEGERPYGENTWAVVDENEGGIVAYVGSLELAVLVGDAIRAKYTGEAALKVGDRIRTLSTVEVQAYGLRAGMRGVITSVEGSRIGFLTHDEIADGGSYPWWAQPHHLELDK